MEQLLEAGRITRSAESGPDGDYREHLATVKEQGYAVNDGFSSFEEVGISAVVRDYRDEVVGCITMSAPRSRTGPDRIAAHSDQSDGGGPVRLGPARAPAGGPSAGRNLKRVRTACGGVQMPEPAKSSGETDQPEVMEGDEIASAHDHRSTAPVVWLIDESVRRRSHHKHHRNETHPGAEFGGPAVVLRHRLSFTLLHRTAASGCRDTAEPTGDTARAPTQNVRQILIREV